MLKAYLFSILFLLFLFSPLSHPAAAAPTVLVFGDSLSAGYGINLADGWVSLLEKRLKEGGFPHHVVNASISGDTSAGGLARLPSALQRFRPEIVVLELGGNDGLRALSLQAMEDNLAAMIELCRHAGAQVVLTEMRIPPNYGPRYTEKFQDVYTDLASRFEVTLTPFLLEGIAGNSALMQSDGIHPRAEAQRLILDNVWPALEPLLSKSLSRAVGSLKGEWCATVKLPGPGFFCGYMAASSLLK